MPAAIGLRRHAIGTLPVWRGKTDVRELPGSLLSTRAARTGQGGDALRRAADVMGTSCHERAPLA